MEISQLKLKFKMKKEEVMLSTLTLTNTWLMEITLVKRQVNSATSQFSEAIILLYRTLGSLDLSLWMIIFSFLTILHTLNNNKISWPSLLVLKIKMLFKSVSKHNMKKLLHFMHQIKMIPLLMLTKKLSKISQFKMMTTQLIQLISHQWQMT